MFEGGLAQRTPLRRSLHLQALQEVRFAAIPAVAIGAVVETQQSCFHLGNLVEVALLFASR